MQVCYFCFVLYLPFYMLFPSVGCKCSWKTRSYRFAHHTNVYHFHPYSQKIEKETYKPRYALFASTDKEDNRIMPSAYQILYNTPFPRGRPHFLYLQLTLVQECYLFLLTLCSPPPFRFLFFLFLSSGSVTGIFRSSHSTCRSMYSST